MCCADFMSKSDAPGKPCRFRIRLARARHRVYLLPLVALSVAIGSWRLSIDSASAQKLTSSSPDGNKSSDGEAACGHPMPMLPSKPYDYSTLDVPANVDLHCLEEADNTPPDNPLTDAGATLGRVLFYDTQLSRNNTIACASCHHQKAGFSDPRQFSAGFEGAQTTRNAMNLANLRFSNLMGRRPGFFWDERAPTLEAQVLLPIQDPIEMGMQLNELTLRLGGLNYYPPLFEAAFGSTQVTSDRIAKALAQFLRSMLAFDSKFDRAAAKTAAGDYTADFVEFTAQENLGKSLFINGVRQVAELGCAFCHMPPTFGMPKALNNGLDWNSKDRGLGALGRPPNDPFTPSNEGKFKAPSLRNIELTAPYMHDGRLKTLEDVVEHYSGRVQPHENLGLAFDEEDRDKGMSGFKFTDDQKAALVAFLKTLTDSVLVSDPRFSDPFAQKSVTE
jgi:cytochrome c peroxidase